MLSKNINELLQVELFNNTLLDWGVAFGIGAVVLTALLSIKHFSLSRIKALAARTDTVWDDALVDMLARTRSLAALVVSVYAGSFYLQLNPQYRSVLDSVLAVTLIVQAGLWLNHLLAFWLVQDRKRRLAEDPSSIAAINALGFVGKLVLWSVAVLLALDNLGINVTALVAGLGVGGIAVALAVQNILGDLFASLSIALDKPFAVGDFLIIDEHLGSVEHIGLKTTRLRSLSGEQLVFSNTDLLSSRIKNYGRMYERRVVFKLGVTYQTPREQLRQIPQIIKEAIEAQQPVRFDRSHFQAYGAFSLDFETVYYVLKPDYNIYMDIQQAINLLIHQGFEEQGIEFAYPTQTLHLVDTGDQTGGTPR